MFRTSTACSAELTLRPAKLFKLAINALTTMLVSYLERVATSIAIKTLNVACHNLIHANYLSQSGRVNAQPPSFELLQ